MPLYPPSGSSSGVTSVSGTAPVASSGGTTPAISMAASTDSANGYLTSADHTTLTSLSGQATGVAPVFIAVGIPAIGWKSGIDLKANATTSLFTVPTSRTFVALGAYVIPTAVTGGAAVTFTYSIKESGGALAMTSAVAAGSLAPVTTKTWTQSTAPANGPFGICAAGNIVQLVISTGFTTSTTVTGSCFVWGFYAT